MLQKVLVLIEICLLGLFLYAHFWAHARKRKEEKMTISRIWRCFLPVGWLIADKALKNNKRLHKELKQLYPSAKEAEICQEYRAQRISQIFAAIVVCNTIAIWGAGGLGEAENVGYELARPAYEEGDGTEILNVRLEESELTLRIKVPRQEPTAEQIQEMLLEAEYALKAYVEDLGVVSADIQLPVQQGEVQIRYESDVNMRIGDNGRLHWLQEQGEWEQPLRASLFYGDYSRSCELSLPVNMARGISVEHQIEEAMAEAGMTDTALLLPESITMGTDEEALVWYTSDRQEETLQWIFILWLLPFLIIPIGRRELKQRVRDRQKRIQNAYPNMLQKLTIFLSAGLSIQAAWERAAGKGGANNPLAEEMNITRIQMRHGMAPQEALRQFGHRIHNAELRRMANMLCRNLRRGDEFLLEHLKEMNHTAWEEHKRNVKIQSEEAETKLLIPMLLLLVVVLIIVLAPVLITMYG